MYRTDTTYVVFFIMLFLIFVSAIYPMIVSEKENFSNLGKYPSSVETPLLADTYHVKKHPGLSKNNASDIYVNYPVFPATSINNNNIRFWRRPTNGKCTAPDICGGIYRRTEQTIPPHASPPAWDGGIRVNYYDSQRGC